MKNNRLTIKDVASASGVSIQTVSRVLNDRPDVAPETRERILHIIDGLNYSPSALARSMISQRSYTIGIIIAGLNLSGPLYTLNAITVEVEKLGYTLLLKELPNFETTLVDPLLRSLLDYHVDGIVCAVPEVGENRRWLANIKLTVPIVFMSRRATKKHTVISLDNYTGAYLATTHLIQQGYKEIGHISGPLDWWETRERKRGWQDALRIAGRDVPKQAIVEGDWSLLRGYQAAEKLLMQYPGIDAIFAANDQTALSILLKASRIGKKVPDELGVIGFDNITESAYYSPPLTTIAQDYQAMGHAAVHELVSLIKGGQNKQIITPKFVSIPPYIVIRESTDRLHHFL